MASPTIMPHLAAKLPGVTYNKEKAFVQWEPQLLDDLPFSAPTPPAPAVAAAAI